MFYIIHEIKVLFSMLSISMLIFLVTPKIQASDRLKEDVNIFNGPSLLAF